MKKNKIYSRDGMVYIEVNSQDEDISKMLVPVKCNHCGTVYDLTKAKVEHRYADCDVFRTPCCDKLADTREFKSFKDFTRLEKITEHVLI